MGRYVSLYIAPTVNLGLRGVSPGFGSGSFQFFGSSGTFTIPTGTSQIRVTALGPGGPGCYYYGRCCCGCRCLCWCNNGYANGPGGGGGGYVIATVDVTPGCVCTVTVGAACGAATCIGSQVVAFGGCGGCVSPTCASTQCGGPGGSFCVGIGATLILGYCGNRGVIGRSFVSGASGCTQQDQTCSSGGASGSQIGGNGCGGFPGTTCTDIFSCKAFNGEDITETDAASKFTNVIRWPGEAILSTSRQATSITGTSAGFPLGCYKVLAFGGGVSMACTCSQCQNCNDAGCGGGGSGWSNVNCVCRNSCPYQATWCGESGDVKNGNPGAGYIVIEY